MNFKTCSNCIYWGDHKTNIDGVLAASCETITVAKTLLPAVYETTKGSDKCSKWKKLKYREVYNGLKDEMQKVRDFT